MNQHTSLFKAVLAGALFLGVGTQVNAERVFPPNHLAPAASFPQGTASEQPVAEAWYQSETSAGRVAIQANEIQEASPYPSLYYFVNIRSHANDENAKLEQFREARRDIEVQIADETIVIGNDS